MSAHIDPTTDAATLQDPMAYAMESDVDPQQVMAATPAPEKTEIL